MSRIRVPVVLAAAALAVVVVIAMFTGSTAAPAVPPVVGTAAVTSSTLVCPDIDGKPAPTTSRAAVVDVAGALSPPSLRSGSVTATVLGAKTTTTPIHVSPAATLPSMAKTNRSIALTATGSVAATLAADQVTQSPAGRHRALSGVRCETAATDWWFAGADGRVGFTDTLVLANPAPTPALVSVSLWGSKGSLLNTRLGSLRIGPFKTRHIGIATAAPDVARVAVHVHATSGAVTAALFDRRTAALKSEGADFVPATQAPSRSFVVSGFAAGKGSRQLEIADPGAVDATIGLRAVTPSGSFIPTGDNQLVVRAGHTRVVNLDRAFDSTTAAVQVTSDQPVVGEGLSVTPAPPHRPDLMWLAATAPLSGPAAIADGREPDGGRTLLLLSAPLAAAQVRVNSLGGDSTVISVRAGRSVEVDITSTVRTSGGQWPFVVTPIGTGPVYGVRVLSFGGAHGALITGEPLVSLPRPIPLPPVRNDPSVAIR